MHHRSPQHSKPSPSSELLASKVIEPQDPVDLNMQRSYLSKLRTQRQKIEKLYLSYEESQATNATISSQNATLKTKLASLQQRLQIEQQYKSLTHKFQTLTSVNSELQLENQQLRGKYEDKFVENNKKLKQLKEYYNEENQELMIEINMVKDLNKQLEYRVEELKVITSKMKVELAEKDKVIENIKKLTNETATANTNERNEFLQLLAERDNEHKRIKQELLSLKQKHHQQAYFIELQKQKNEELTIEYTNVILKQKMQIESLQRQLLIQLQENNKHIETEQKYLILANEAKGRYQIICGEYEGFKKSEKDARDKMGFRGREEKRRLEERVELLEEEVKTGNKEFALLVGKYERLQGLMKRREMNENAKRELIRYEHQEIDKMDLIFRM